MSGSGAATEDEKKPMEQRINLKLKRRCATRDKSYLPALSKSRSNFQKKKANAKDNMLVDEGFGDSEDCYHTLVPCDFSEGTAVSRSPLNTCSSKERKRGSSYRSKLRINDIHILSKAYDILMLKMVEDQKTRERNFSEGIAVSRSPLNTCSSKEHKRGSSYRSKLRINDIHILSKAYDILMLKMVEDQKTRERNLYRAVKSMEQVKLRGPAFLARAICYLTESKLDKMFLVFKTDEAKWEWLKHLSD